MSWAVILTFWWVCAGMCVCSEVCRPQCWMHFSSIYAACSNPLWTPPSLSGVFYPENVDFFPLLFENMTQFLQVTWKLLPIEILSEDNPTVITVLKIVIGK